MFAPARDSAVPDEPVEWRAAAYLQPDAAAVGRRAKSHLGSGASLWGVFRKLLEKERPGEDG